MAGLAQLASDRSADDAAAAEENRAWLRALALYATGQSMASMWPGAQGWPRPRPRAVMLLGRDDFPQHFVVSALLAMEAGGPFADALGLAKKSKTHASAADSASPTWPPTGPDRSSASSPRQLLSAVDRTPVPASCAH